MELIPYVEFAELRLAQFVPQPEEIQALEDWEFMDFRWVGEGIGFTQWLRPLEHPDELRVLSLDLPELPFAVNQRVMEALKLPLRQGMDITTVTELLGETLRTFQYIPDRVTHEFFCGGENPYRVDCTFSSEGGLVYVLVMREY